MVMFANLSLFYSENHTLQVILKHDDFCTVNPLDNKTNTKKNTESNLKIVTAYSTNVKNILQVAEM